MPSRFLNIFINEKMPFDLDFIYYKIYNILGDKSEKN